MIDFTQPNYMYQRFQEQLILMNYLRNCKTKEERKKAIEEHQGMSLISKLAAFVAALVICGIISIFT